MKLESILRSPFMSIIAILLIGSWVTYQLIPGTDHLENFLLTAAVIFALTWVTLTIWHNKRNPKKRISLTGFPPEIREDDEGLRYLTMQAARKTYIFVYNAIPIALVVTIWIQTIIVPVISLCLIGIVQQLIYWLELRKWYHEN